MALTASLSPQGVKEFKCEVCGREFTLQANMKRHMLIHTSVRPYQCHICFKTFVQKQTLKTHMIVHSPVKPFKCKVPGALAGGRQTAGTRSLQVLETVLREPGGEGWWSQCSQRSTWDSMQLENRVLGVTPSVQGGWDKLAGTVTSKSALAVCGLSSGAVKERMGHVPSTGWGPAQL